MNTTLPEKPNSLPLVMQLARELEIPPASPATYNAQTQICDEFEASVTNGGSTCTRGSSTKEGFGDVFSKSDSDRKKDD